MNAEKRRARIAYWPTEHFGTSIVPLSPPDYVIRHADRDYPTLAAAERDAAGSFRVITYGPKDPTL